MAVFTIKKGDTLPTLQAQLTSGPDVTPQTPVDLTTGTAVVLVMRPVAGGLAVRKTSAFLSPRTDGKVEYVWTAGDTDTIGDYNCEWEVTFGAGKIQSYPNDSYFTVTVFSDLG